MAWCVKGKRGLWERYVKTTRAAAIDYALEVYWPEWTGRGGTTRLSAWNLLKRQYGLCVVEVEVTELVRETSGLTDADRLAMAVLRGDAEAALALADLVLETYHATAKGG